MTDPQAIAAGHCGPHRETAQEASLSEAVAGAASKPPAVPPLLAKLKLTQVQLAALRRQGFISVEQRGNRIVVKVRFRVDGKQTVRFAGTDPARAERLAAELRDWQQCRRLELTGSRLRREFSRWRRDAKRQLGGLVEAMGFRFHGQDFRTPRDSQVAARRVE